jgi:hypothetical protein
MELVVEKLECPSQVALPAVGVAGQEEVERASPRLGQHGRHRLRTVDRPPAVRDLEDESGVDEPVARDEAVLLGSLTRRSEALVLPRRGLADPARGTQSADIVERRRELSHFGRSWVGRRRTTRMFTMSSVIARSAIRTEGGPSG